MSLRDNLIAARALIADPKNWGQGDYAMTREGVSVSPISKDAACFCSYGAVAHAAGQEFPEAERTALRSAARRLYGNAKGPITVNDNLGHEATLAMFDDAISHA
jgi:hypothetical protein